MKILNWNIQTGGGGRIEGIISYLEKESPDITVLTEVRKNKNLNKILDCLNSIGSKNHLIPKTSKNSTNTVLVSSKKNLTQSKYVINNPDLSERCILVQSNGINICSVFCNKPSTYKELEVLFTKCSIEDENFILTGDLYFGPTGSNPNSYNKLNSLIDLGFIDVWRYMKGDIIEWSHFNSAGGKSQPDHFMSSKRLAQKVVGISYGLDELKSGVSDHAPMKVILP